jgi:hypothetical protein
VRFQSLLYVNYGLHTFSLTVSNRQEWQHRGQEIVEEMLLSVKVDREDDGLIEI